MAMGITLNVILALDDYLLRMMGMGKGRKGREGKDAVV
jgi:hypothetical protein